MLLLYYNILWVHTYNTKYYRWYYSGMFLHHHHHRCKKVLTCKYRCAPNLINSVILVSISQTNKKLFFGGFHQPLPSSSLTLTQKLKNVKISSQHFALFSWEWEIPFSSIIVNFGNQVKKNVKYFYFYYLFLKDH